jgi:hypothetical protein
MARSDGGTLDVLLDGGDCYEVLGQTGSKHIAAILLERHTATADCSRMEPSIQYRKFAEECRRLAKSAKTADERKVLQEMEAIWTQLAEAADKKSS